MNALRAILARSVTTLITLFGVAVIVFVVIRIVPGNPIAMMLPPGASQADIDRLSALYGFDKPILQQFAIWLGSVLQGDFGTSISIRRNVLSIVLNRLPATLELSLLALLVAIAIGTVLAFVATRWRETPAETAVDVASGVGLSVPDFLWGLALILTLGVAFPVFEISGRVSPRLDLPFVTQFYLIESLLRLRFDITADLLDHMIMPSLALGLPLAAVIAQLLKASLKDAMAQDYVMLARTKGFSESRVIIRDALRNAMLPTLTLTGVQLTFLIGGTVIVERIFSYEGLGNLAIDAVINRDLPLIQGIVISFAALFVAINLGVDILYALLNPRVRRG
jgi:peptide/nickel transport system permease protein